MTKSLAILIFNIIFNFGTYDGYLCPLKEELVKCSCRNMWSSLHVECQSVSTDAQLTKDLAVFKTTHAYMDLTICYSRLANLTKKVFQGTYLKSLTMQNVLLIGVDGQSFAGSENTLEAIKITGHLLNSVPVEALRPLNRLISLDLSLGGQFGYIASGTFSNMLYHLRSLVLSLCNIKHVDRNAFESLIRLRHLDLSNNPLTQIQPDMLPTNNYLQELIIQ